MCLSVWASSAWFFPLICTEVNCSGFYFSAAAFGVLVPFRLCLAVLCKAFDQMHRNQAALDTPFPSVCGAWSDSPSVAPCICDVCDFAVFPSDPCC